MKQLIFCILLLLLSTVSAQIKNGVGLVKRVKVSLPGELLVAAKVDDKSDAMVRIISTQKLKNGYSYDLEFIGLEPGKYNLVKYLRTASTNEFANIPEYLIEVSSSLETDFSGELLDFQKTVPNLTPWYKNLNRGLIVFWVLLLPAIVLFGRRKKKVEKVIEVKEKSLNEKICELLATLEGKSSKELWQKIEGLIFQHWCQKKDLDGMPMHEAISKLKADDEAGPFILKLEEGLHSKEFRNEKQVTELIRSWTEEESSV